MKRQTFQNRANLLADVAEMYYCKGKTQAEISKSIGVTRSMVSRMLTEARESGIVEIYIRRPLQHDTGLESMLKEKYELKEIFVVVSGFVDREKLIRLLGNAGAQMLTQFLAPHIVLGLTWGTTISATVDAINVKEYTPIKVVELVGAMGARLMEYDGHDIVTRIARKLGGEAYYLNAPFLCQTADIAKALINTQGVRETIALGKKVDIALLGIGTTRPEYSSFYQAGYVSRDEITELRRAGAIGDVCGLHFDIEGQPACESFCERLVTIRRGDLLKIPVRLAVAGGEWKADAILGALRSKLVNALVVDNITAKKVLELEKTR
ncbi:MAG: sugar-binding transcriptional regulator [Chloroflexota bacterium]